MTFYNVISALIFFGAFQQLLIAIAADDAAHLLMAATLAVLVFNDAVYTSHVVEGDKTVTYTLPLMLNDLLNFCLLAGAIAVLNPTQNVFEVNLSSLFGETDDDELGRLSETWFWLILGVYWISILFWTWRAGKYQAGYPAGLLIAEGLITDGYPEERKVRYPRTLFLLAMLVAILFSLQALFVWKQWALPATLGRAAALGYVLAYVAILRPYLLKRWKHRQVAAIKAP